MDWRLEREGVESVASRSILDHEEVLPVGYDWRRSRRGSLPGGEIRTFRIPREERVRVMGRRSLVLVREGRPIEEVVTAQS